MSARYSFEVDPSRDLVKIRMGGFFEPADLDGFLEARRAAHARLLCAPNRHLTLNDLRDLKIQSQATVEGFRRILADPAYRSRRLAFVTGPTLTTSQLRRALGNRHARCFQDAPAAEAWLLTPEQARAA